MYLQSEKLMDSRLAITAIKQKRFAEHLESRFLPNSGSDELPELSLNDYEDTIPLITPKEVAEEIRTNFNPMKAPSFVMITGTILMKFQRKGLVQLTTLINASTRLKDLPASWEVSEVIILPKPRNNHTDV
jgi:hypothetical protein